MGEVLSGQLQMQRRSKRSRMRTLGNSACLTKTRLESCCEHGSKLARSPRRDAPGDISKHYFLTALTSTFLIAAFQCWRNLLTCSSRWSQFPKLVADTLRMLSTDREGVCRPAEGKQLLFYSSKLCKQRFLQRCAASVILLRWLAWPEIHQKCIQDPARKQADVSTLFFLWFCCGGFHFTGMCLSYCRSKARGICPCITMA